MITNTFDENTVAIINPKKRENRVKCDVCIVTFSHEIVGFVIKNFNPTIDGDFKCVNGLTPIYVFEYKGKTFGFYKTLLGAPASVGIFEDANTLIDTQKFVVFGSAGVLNQERCLGRVVVPTHAYRDEGTSYHYAKAEDYIEITNSKLVAKFMEKHKIPYVEGRCWTTDAFYRETAKNLELRKAEGCLIVDMECSAIQAVSNFRGKELYYFMLSGDLLDSPEWDETNLNNANHNIKNFDIALHLAYEI